MSGDSSDDTPRSAKIIRDYIVSEMRDGFTKVHDRIDKYRGEAQETNVMLRSHVDTCDQRYAEMLSRSGGDMTGIVRRKRSFADKVFDKVKDRIFDYAIVVVFALLYFALTHGAHLPTP